MPKKVGQGRKRKRGAEAEDFPEVAVALYPPEHHTLDVEYPGELDWNSLAGLEEYGLYRQSPDWWRIEFGKFDLNRPAASSGTSVPQAAMFGTPIPDKFPTVRDALMEQASRFEEPEKEWKSAPITVYDETPLITAGLSPLNLAKQRKRWTMREWTYDKRGHLEEIPPYIYGLHYEGTDYRIPTAIYIKWLVAFPICPSAFHPLAWGAWILWVRQTILGHTIDPDKKEGHQLQFPGKIDRKRIWDLIPRLMREPVANVATLASLNRWLKTPEAQQWDLDTDFSDLTTRAFAFKRGKAIFQIIVRSDRPMVIIPDFRRGFLRYITKDEPQFVGIGVPARPPYGLRFEDWQEGKQNRREEQDTTASKLRQVVRKRIEPPCAASQDALYHSDDELWRLEDSWFPASKRPDEELRIKAWRQGCTPKQLRTICGDRQFVEDKDVGECDERLARMTLKDSFLPRARMPNEFRDPKKFPVYGIGMSDIPYSLREWDQGKDEKERLMPLPIRMPSPDPMSWSSQSGNESWNEGGNE